ncbi:MAG: hypothetical protein ACK6EB_28350, partial [Planctomyces sp.]
CHADDRNAAKRLLGHGWGDDIGVANESACACWVAAGRAGVGAAEIDRCGVACVASSGPDVGA